MSDRAFIMASTPEQAFMLLREAISEYTAVVSGAHDWDLLYQVQGIAIALEVLQDLETMILKFENEAEGHKVCERNSDAEIERLNAEVENLKRQVQAHSRWANTGVIGDGTDGD